MGKNKSRPQRWADAVSTGQDAVSRLKAILEDIEENKNKVTDNHINDWAKEAGILSNAMSELDGLREEYEEWQSNLPENLQQSALGEKLEAVCSLNFTVDEFDGIGADSDEDDLQSALSDVENIEDELSDAENADLPRGFGKD